MKPNEGCERVEARLDEYLDDALGDVEAALDRGHLEACSSCRREEAARRAQDRRR